MYADKVTNSIERTISETNRRREKQLKYNDDNDITPQQIIKTTLSLFEQNRELIDRPNVYAGLAKADLAADPVVQYMNEEALQKAIDNAKKSMEKAASELDFIEAARFRDEMYAYQELLKEKTKKE